MIVLARIRCAEPCFGVTYAGTHYKQHDSDTALCGATLKEGEYWVEGYYMKCQACMLAVANMAVGNAIASGEVEVTHELPSV
jgi:hypothetical protein